LQQVIEGSIQAEELRQEVSKMGKTMADVLTEEGERKGRSEAAIETRQQTLVRLLRRRFDSVPPGVVATVESTADVDQLDDWLDRLVTAETLDELGIPEAK